jgi:hypothetical protein
MPHGFRAVRALGHCGSRSFGLGPARLAFAFIVGFDRGDCIVTLEPTPKIDIGAAPRAKRAKAVGPPALL